MRVSNRPATPTETAVWHVGIKGSIYSSQVARDGPKQECSPSGEAMPGAHARSGPDVFGW